MGTGVWVPETLGSLLNSGVQPFPTKPAGGARGPLSRVSGRREAVPLRPARRWEMLGDGTR